MKRGSGQTRRTNLNLGPGQYEALEAIAEFSDGEPSVSSLVRQAVHGFIMDRSVANPSLAARIEALRVRGNVLSLAQRRSGGGEKGGV
jgi:hypothetical protein